MHYTLCELLTDVTQNSVEAGASKITVEFNETDEALKVSIRDNGKGMDAATLERIKDPFYTDGIKHPKRRVGLGIPFLIQTVTETGGSWNIESAPGSGTTVFMTFDLSNIDTPPVGDVPGFFRQILMFQGTAENYDLEIIRTKTQNTANLNYTILRSELIDALGGIEDADSLVLLGQYLSGLEEPEE